MPTIKVTKAHRDCLRKAKQRMAIQARTNNAPSIYLGLCHFLAQSAEDRIARQIQTVIQARLGEVSYLYSWLAFHHKVCWAVLNTKRGKRKLLATRIAWATALLDEFKLGKTITY